MKYKQMYEDMPIDESWTIEKECDYVSEIASEYIDSEIGNELIEDNKPLFDLHKKLSEVQ